MDNVPRVAVHFDGFPGFVEVSSMNTWALIFGNTSSTAIQYQSIGTHAARNTFCDILHIRRYRRRQLVSAQKEQRTSRVVLSFDAKVLDFVKNSLIAS